MDSASPPFRVSNNNIESEVCLMGILSWIVLGLVAGALAQWIMPGKNGGGIFMTMILGIVGAIVGGWVSTFFGFGSVSGFNIGSLVIAVLGALIVLFVHGKFFSKK